MCFKFKSASENESIVYGAQRPGYSSKSVNGESVRKWILFMKKYDIKRICCLLSKEQLNYYSDDLLDTYLTPIRKNLATTTFAGYQWWTIIWQI